MTTRRRELFVTMHRQTSGQRGFTLIEMMIVVAIIAILAGILVPNFVRARAQAQTAACEANLKEIATALELYETDNDKYPSSNTLNASDTDLQPYLKQIPVDPAAGPSVYYTYTVTNGATSTAAYTIVCPGSHDPGTLQNMTPGTTDTHIQYTSGAGFAATNQ
jgi:type II secretion system protein G